MRLKNVHKAVLYYNNEVVAVGEEFEVDENHSLVQHWMKQEGVVEEVKASKPKKVESVKKSKVVEKPLEVVEKPKDEVKDVMAEPKKKKLKESDE